MLHVLASNMRCCQTSTTIGAAVAAAAVEEGLQQPPFERQRLFRPGVLEAVDWDGFSRDGFIVFPGALTEWGGDQFTTALQRLQGILDHLILHTDWAGEDWERHGMRRPKPSAVTPDKLRGYCGGQEREMNLLPNSKQQPAVGHDARAGVYHADPKQWRRAPIAFPPGVPNLGVSPHQWPHAYDDFLWDLITLAHPEFRWLQSKLLGSPVCDIRVDHVGMLNRHGPDPGRAWHGHPYDQDGWGPTTKYTGLGLVRTLAYPQGCGMKEGDGGLSLVPGAHLHRDPFSWNTHRSASTARSIGSRWLQGKRHPATGEKLQVKAIRLPPGSLVCFSHHMPHFVGEISNEYGTRLALLMVYRRPDPKRRIRSLDRNVPDEWVEMRVEEGLLTTAQQRLFSEF